MSRSALALALLGVVVGVATCLEHGSTTTETSATPLPAGARPRPWTSTSERATELPRGTPRLGRRHLPSLAELAHTIATIDPPVCAAEQQWTPSAAQLARYPAEFEGHVTATGRYLNEVFAPLVADCVRDVRPLGLVEVTHSFVIDDDGLAVPAAVAGMTDDAITVADADMTPDDVDQVVGCMRAVAATTTFEYVPIAPDASITSFVAYQHYGFAPRR